MSKRNQRGSDVLAGLAVLCLIAIIVAIATSSSHRSKHSVKLIKTHDKRILVHNRDGSWWEFVRKTTANAPDFDFDIDLPATGSSAFRLPAGNWQRIPAGPRNDEIEDEEESTVEEADSGQPQADADGDVGADSDGNSAASDSGGSGGDSGGSGGDSGGDGGGGDGGGE